MRFPTKLRLVCSCNQTSSPAGVVDTSINEAALTGTDTKSEPDRLAEHFNCYFFFYKPSICAIAKNMKSLLVAQFLVAGGLTVASALPSLQSPRADQASNPYPRCRFVADWSQEDVLKDPTGFEQDLLFWEGKFHQNDVSYNSANGMTYDGTQLNWTTGARSNKHPFSAASKEVLGALYTQVFSLKYDRERDLSNSLI